MKDKDIKDFLFDIRATVEQTENDGFLISLPGTQEKAAPTLQDAFFLWVAELVLQTQGTPTNKLRQQQQKFKLKRNYQFPKAVWFENDAENNISAWVVNVVGNKPFYGVVRYFADGDRRAWIESESFDEAAAKAKAWCKETVAQLREEIKL